MSDEQASKVAKFDSSNALLQQNEEDDYEPEFYVILCFDNLLEVLRSGCRRRLTKLERIGRRLHLIIEKCFSKIPLLRLDILFMNGGLGAFIGPCGGGYGGKKQISFDDLKEFPVFLRFYGVHLPYSTWVRPIEEKCQLYGGILPAIKGALNDSNEIHFDAGINQKDQSEFYNHSALIAYLRDEFLPICDSSRRYKFVITFDSDQNSGSKIISSILKMPQVVQCSNVNIWLLRIFDPIELSVGEIAQWLNQKNDRIGKNTEEKFLEIYSYKIQNVLEICEHLTEAFRQAMVPETPFTFTLFLDFFVQVNGLEEQLLTNMKTNEELSIMMKAVNNVKIKRAVKKKNDS